MITLLFTIGIVELFMLATMGWLALFDYFEKLIPSGAEAAFRQW
jgi:hypothetical protein